MMPLDFHLEVAQGLLPGLLSAHASPTFYIQFRTGCSQNGEQVLSNEIRVSNDPVSGDRQCLPLQINASACERG